ncbi:MAG: hypothetical protein Rubg2KO_27320 [Rubricoccaceae bacterium]
MARICIVTGAHLCRNPRVVKEASALADAGHSVTVLGPRLSAPLATEDALLSAGALWEHRYVVDITAGGSRFLHRASRRLGEEAAQRLGLNLPDGLGYGMRAMLSAARRENADLTIGHQEVGLWVVFKLLQDGRCVGADFEDWYSRDLTPEAQKRRPIQLLRQCERLLAQRGAHTTTTSHALAEGLASAYDAPLPRVVYNAFPWADRETLDGRFLDRTVESMPSLHWVSQTLGVDRGLDVLFDALHHVSTPVQVHLRGRPAPEAEEALRALFPAHLGHQLALHPLVPPHELLSRISEHDIGIAFESTTPDSRDLTVTNKILHYLLGGLSVVASDTSGQREIANVAPDAVFLCGSRDPDTLATHLNDLLDSPARLAAAKAAALNVAHRRFSWERQAPVLQASVDRSLCDPAALA